MTGDADRDEATEGGGDQLREEAATWFARMRGDDAEQHRAAFEAWLARGAVHRAAYNRIGEIFAAGKALKGFDVSTDAPPARRVASGGIVVALVAFVAVLVGIGVWQARGPGGERASQRTAEASGQLRPSVAGEDGFRDLGHGVRMLADADGVVSAPVAGDPMLARLERGRARFSVSGSESSQHVLAGPAEAIASDASFDLWLRMDGSLDAQVLSGRVGFRPAVLTLGGGNAVDHPLTWVSAGQRYRIAAAGHAEFVPNTLGRDWPTRILEYRRARLADVLEEANRYSSTKIVIAGPSLADRLVSGRFRINDAHVLAERLAQALGLVVADPRPGVIELRALD